MYDSNRIWNNSGDSGEGTLPAVYRKKILLTNQEMVPSHQVELGDRGINFGEGILQFRWLLA